MLTPEDHLIRLASETVDRVDLYKIIQKYSECGGTRTIRLCCLIYGFIYITGVSPSGKFRRLSLNPFTGCQRGASWFSHYQRFSEKQSGCVPKLFKQNR